jgi:hypothetical protein
MRTFAFCSALFPQATYRELRALRSPSGPCSSLQSASAMIANKAVCQPFIYTSAKALNGCFLESEQHYRNPYQIDSNRFLPREADLADFPMKSHVLTSKKGDRLSIPTLASNCIGRNELGKKSELQRFLQRSGRPLTIRSGTGHRPSSAR